MMARIQPADDDAVKEPTYDTKAISEVNASNKMIPNRVHEHKNHRKRNTVVNTSIDDQIDTSIIFDYPYVENKGGSNEHDLNAHDPYHDSHINPSYSQSPQSYDVTHPSSVVDYEEDYQEELQRDSQDDKITTAMMLLARAIT
nr:hypothetical protein [Tanacetum cinerariifolium]